MLSFYLYYTYLTDYFSTQTQDASVDDIKWTREAMTAIQDSAEAFVTQAFMRADIARGFSGRKTLSVRDLQYSNTTSQLMPCQEPLQVI